MSRRFVVTDVDDQGHPLGEKWTSLHTDQVDAQDQVTAHAAASPGANPWRAFALVGLNEHGQVDHVDVFQDVHQVLHTHQRIRIPGPVKWHRCACGWGTGQNYTIERHRHHLAQEITKIVSAAAATHMQTADVAKSG